MQNNGTKFKIIFLGIFGLLALAGMLALITYRNKPVDATLNIPITVWGTMPAAPFNALLKNFADQKNDLKISYVQKSPDTIYNDTIEAIASGISPDVLLVSQDLLHPFLSKLTIVPFSAFSQTDYKNNFVEGANIFLQGGGITAVPFAVDPLMLYWNKDLFANAGLAVAPQSWSEFPMLAEKLTKTENISDITQSAVSFGGYANVNNAKAILSTLFFQTGNPITTLTNTGYASAIGGFPSVSVPLNFYTEYSNPKKSVYSWNDSMPSSKKAFLSEQLATYFGFNSEKNTLQATNPNLNFDVAFMPQAADAKNKVTFGNIYGFAFLKTSSNFSVALPRIFQLIGTDSIKAFSENSDFAPIRRDVIAAGPTDPSKKIFYDSALIAKSFWDPNPSASDEVFKNMIEDISSGRLDIGKSIEKGNNALNNLL